MKRVLTVCILLAAFAASAFALTSAQAASQFESARLWAEQMKANAQNGKLSETDLAKAASYIADMKRFKRLNEQDPIYLLLLDQVRTENGNRGRLDQGDDACPGVLIASLPYNDTGWTVGLAQDVGTCVSFAGAPDVIYQYTSTANVVVHLSLCGGTDYDSSIEVYADACFGGTSLGCNDDSGCDDNYFASQLDVCLLAGHTYYIVISGYGSAAGNYNFTADVIGECAPPPPLGRCCYDFTCAAPVTREECASLGGDWTEGLLDCESNPCPPPPCNVDFTQAAPFSAGGDLTGAGDDCGLRGGDDQLWEIQIPHAGNWTFTLCGSDAASWDSYIYLGTNCCSADLAINDDNLCGGFGSLASTIPCIPLVTGTYYLDVEGFGGSGAAYTLQVYEDCAPPTGRCCYRFNDVDLCAVTLAVECRELGGLWSEGQTCDTPCPTLGHCGPIDLVFAIDNTGSMGGAINNIIAELPNIAAAANFASGGDLRLGLLTFPNDVAHTIDNLTFNQALVLGDIAAITAGGGNNIPEASDETLREIITNDGCTDGTEFTSPFRLGALKIIVLVTDALPGGCDDQFDFGVDDVNAHQRALDAAGLGIRIAAIDVGGASATILQDYATTSAGTYTLLPFSGEGAGQAVAGILDDCAQGALQLDVIQYPELICEGGYLVPNPAIVGIRVTNSGTATCHNVVVDLNDGAGPGGTWVTVTGPQNVGDLAPASFFDVFFQISIVNVPGGGLICAPATVVCADCPNNFIGVCVQAPPCEVVCDPDNAYFDAALPLPQSACLNLCPEVDTWIYVSNVPIGYFPVVSIAQGCSFRTRCNEDCSPATYTEQIINWFINDDGVWCLVIRGDGCVCVTLERILSVELNSFDVAAHDGSVELNWSTRSETNNDHFEIVRDGSVVARVNGLGNSTSGHNYAWTDRNVSNGRTYAYTLVSVNTAGAREEHGTFNATPSFNAGPVSEYALLQNYPNPFNPSTEIAFNLVESGFVTLKVYDLLGREVAELVNGTMDAGAHTVIFDAKNLTSGVYMYRMEVNGFSAEKKMLFMK